MLHTDHCAKKLLPWLDGMLDADEAYFKQHGEPLFRCARVVAFPLPDSSKQLPHDRPQCRGHGLQHRHHSRVPQAVCTGVYPFLPIVYSVQKYLGCVHILTIIKMNQLLELELGITGGEEVSANLLLFWLITVRTVLTTKTLTTPHSTRNPRTSGRPTTSSQVEIPRSSMT